MTTSQHATLTGSSLHEPKGVAAAVANRVYVSDGLGSGSWSQVPAAALASSTRAFEGQLLHVREEQSTGTNGGTPSGGFWNARVLNTVKTNEISGASLASNHIILPAGTYYIEATSPLYYGGSTQLQLWNVTDNATILLGSSQYAAASGNTPVSEVSLKGRFTLAGIKTLELQLYVTNASANGLGLAVNAGTPEVYSEVLIWKVA